MIAIGVASMDARGETAMFLERELKYVPVADFVPLASDALAQHHGLDSKKAETKKGKKPGEPDGLLIGGTLIVSDAQLNKIVVSGKPEALKIVDDLANAIDVRPRQVYVEAVIAEVELGKKISQGIDILRAVESIEHKGKQFKIADLLSGGQSGPAIFDPAKIGEEKLVFGAGSKNETFLRTYVAALESTGKLMVLSRPFVFTANNQKAEIASGERIGLPTERKGIFRSRKEKQEEEPAISFEEVMLRLTFTPLINSKDEVTLAMKLRNEELKNRKALKRGKPEIAVSELATTVRMPDKGIVVFGGIARPGGKELLVFLQPRIVSGTPGG